MSLFTTPQMNEICRLVCLQNLVESVYISSVSRFSEWIQIYNKEFVSNFVCGIIANARKDLRWVSFIKNISVRVIQSFKNGWQNVQNMPRSGPSSTSSTNEKVKEVKKIVLENRHISVREIILSTDSSTSFASLFVWF